jgi:DNA-binding NarL/FixJ family response regulator
MNEHAMPTDPHSLSDGSGHHGSNTDGHFADTEPAKEAHSGMMSASGSADDINVGVIDRLQFSRDCLIRAFDAVHPDLCMVPFASIGDCVRAAPADLDLILYYSHDDGPFELLAVQQIKTLRQAFDDVPIIVLSDAKSAVLPRNIRNALNSGAQGFIPTLSTEVPAALAAIRFVRDGGTFAPLDLLFDGQSKQGAAAEEPEPNRLTPRQRTVLSHLSQGKANKIIAYELGMTESTVKVHIRNIMRKMGATNRTQAVYNSQQLSA